MIIPITIPNKKASVPCFVDDADSEKVAGLHWGAMKGTTNKTIYAVNYRNKKVSWMHRVIMDAPEGMDVDHIDGNGLNNRRSNLRVCTRKQNHANRGPNKNNTSGFKGVIRDGENWRIKLEVGGEIRNIGPYSDKKEAAKAWNALAKKELGEFAYQNKIE